jgi:hypothetical protein
MKLREGIRGVYARWRRTVIGPLLDARHASAVLRRIDGASKKARVLGPEELAPYVRLLTPLSTAATLPTDLDFDYVVIRQEWLAALDGRLLAHLHQSYHCAYANARFALFSPKGAAIEESAAAASTSARLSELVSRPIVAASASRSARAPRVGERAILVTTFNRPAALRRSLPQIAALGCSMLVVDDGSEARLAEENRAICDACDARYLLLPGNRGVAAALNIGVAYALAECRIAWLSYLQDDVDVDASLIDRLIDVEHRHERPLITGYDATEHATTREAEIAGVHVKLKATTAGVHLHAHQEYWFGVLPIPTAYLGAPRRRWGPPIEDAWIVHGAPASAGRRGLLVPCIPGLVRTFLWHEADSTWGNPASSTRPVTSASS